MNRQYFNYLNKSKKHLNILLLVINLIFPGIFYLINLSELYFEPEQILIMSLVMAFIEAIILPIIHFSYLNSKSGVDTYLSLPISRREIIWTTLIYICLEIIITHLIVILPIFVFEAGDIFNTIFDFGLYLLSDLLFIVSTILITSAIFFKAYSSIDGVAVILGYLFIPLLLFAAYNVLIDYSTYGLNNNFSSIGYFFYPFMGINSVISNLMYYGDNYYNIALSNCLMVLALLIAIYSINYDIKNRKAEYASSISTNFFAYPLIITLASISVIFLIVFSDLNLAAKITLLACLFVAYVIINCVSRREIRFRFKDLILFFVGIAIAIVVLFSAKITGGYGLETAYRNQDDLQAYHMNITIEKYYEDGANDYFDVRISLNNEYGWEDFEFSKDVKEFIKNRQDLYLDKYNHINKDVVPDHYFDNMDITEGKRIETRLGARYKYLEYEYPDWSSDFVVNSEVMYSIYDVNDPNVLDKIKADVYTLVENGARIYGSYSSELEDGARYEFEDYEGFVLGLERYWG